MADRKISELTNITGADVDDTNDEIAIVDASESETKAITREELFKDIDGDITLSGTVDGRDVAADGSKLDYITVTQNVDLDQVETDIAALANGMVYKGDWDASSGSFPGGGSAQTGWFYYVSVGGTIDGISFSVGDNIVATTDDASATVYASNWSKHDQTDAVSAVVGLTGSISKTSLLSALNVEDGATSDQTASEIKTAYESNADTNAFTDAEQSKLAGIESGAEVNTVDSVNTQTGTVVLDADDIDDSTTTNKFTTAADKSKLDGIESGADVTDTANVTAAGALMDSELTSEASVKALDQGVSTTDSPEFAGITLPSINGGPLAGFRNAIINGNFDHWQRGTSLSGAGYLADRWVHTAAGASGTVTQSRQAFTVGQTDVPNEPTYFYRTQGSSYTFDAANVTQKIEDVRTFAGQTVTLSFWAKASAARDIRPRFLQFFDGSASVNTLAPPVSLTTAWQKFTATVSIPSISGKTIGANSRLELAFDIKEGAFGSNLNNDSIDIAQVQLEAGSVATPFERRPIGTELALCQRYYFEEPNTSRAYLSGSTQNFRQSVTTHPVEMRAVPTVSATTNTGSINPGWNVSTKRTFSEVSVGDSTTFVEVQNFTADAEL